ncbi:hypothetical protein PS1_022332 [Malus domestica]
MEKKATHQKLARMTESSGTLFRSCDNAFGPPIILKIEIKLLPNPTPSFPKSKYWNFSGNKVQVLRRNSYVKPNLSVILAPICINLSSV